MLEIIEPPDHMVNRCIICNLNNCDDYLFECIQHRRHCYDRAYFENKLIRVYVCFQHIWGLNYDLMGWDWWDIVDNL